jgi:hypothetical protein
VTVERRSPLPPGRYWLDVTSKARVADFESYLESTARDAITVERRQDTEIPTPKISAVELQRWYLFRVTRPVRWFAGNFGHPTIAGPSVRTRADTATAPRAEYWWEGMNLDAGSLRAVLWLGVLYAIARETSRN